MEVRLTRIHSTNNNLRTSAVEGVCLELPEAGHTFIMFADALEIEEEGGVRVVETSVVNELIKTGENRYEFTTLNSLYQLEVL